MAAITRFSSGHRRVIGVPPMPDGGRRAFQGTSVARALRLRNEARSRHALRCLR